MKINRREVILLGVSTLIESQVLSEPKLFDAPAPAVSNRNEPLVNEVTIYRDTYGVPHIVGETEQAVFFDRHRTGFICLFDREASVLSDSSDSHFRGDSPLLDVLSVRSFHDH